MITHLDLFSGIGGFSLAIDNTYGKENVQHTFVEWDDFCQEVLKKHWPEAEIHSDIKQFIADSRSPKLEGLPHKPRQKSIEAGYVHFLTGGFPCQPFSQAGRRKGTEDDRYLWPAMLECIALYHPRWVIAENVAGLASWNDGMVLETVCADLEKEGYEVQPFVIPAVAIGAPHRRDRIWFIAHCTSGRERSNEQTGSQSGKSETPIGDGNRDATDTQYERLERRNIKTAKHRKDKGIQFGSENWKHNWLEVATRLCRVDNGIPRRLDRNPRLKALGNAIVPQVAEEIIKIICNLS